MGQVVDQLCALGQLTASKGWKGPQLVISGGAVQVASSTTNVKTPAGPQVDIFASNKLKQASAPRVSSRSPPDPPVAARPAAAGHAHHSKDSSRQSRAGRIEKQSRQQYV